MAQLTILSPTHIATGNLIEAASYHLVGTTAYRYQFTDLLAQIPSAVYSNPRVLNELQNSPKSRSYLHSILKENTNYDLLDPMYQLKCNLDYNYEKYAYDFSEQIKDLGKPYIPGSSIKGALINAWIYSLLKKNYKMIEAKLDNYFYEMKFNKHNCSFLDLFLNNNSVTKGKDLLKEISSCILCRDVYFNGMEVFEANRIGSNKDMSGIMPLSYKECIQANQSSNTVFLTLDDQRISRLKNKYKNDNDVLRLLTQFTKSNLLYACNIYVGDMIEEEITPFYQSFYQEYPTIIQQVKNIKAIINKEKNLDTVNFVLRIGNSTNYFFKSITHLFKINSPDLYQKYFNQLFSPTPNRRKGPVAKANSLPKTRVVISNKEIDYLPGFIMISYDKKS